MKTSYQQIVKVFNRITGLSIPIFGVSWNPPPAEVVIADKLLSFLSDRRVLYTLFSSERADYSVHSILRIRDRLAVDLEQLDHTSNLASSLETMRKSCRDFLEAEQSILRSAGYQNKLFVALSQLRGIFAIEIAKISSQYGIDLDEDLTNLVTRYVEKSTASNT